MASCEQCTGGFSVTEPQIRGPSGQLYHHRCFVCAQCFQPFPDGIFYEFENRNYCEHDFKVLFAPCCAKCGEFIIGRVIRAMGSTWHPYCFSCESCQQLLVDVRFIKAIGRAMCKTCYDREKGTGFGRYVCNQCHTAIEDDTLLKFKGEAYHCYHFKCSNCKKELTREAREHERQLFCLPCFDQLGVIPVCEACHRPVESRGVQALGKHWHVEHFVCARCEKPFFGHRHFERGGRAYCELHFHQLFGNICFVCNHVIHGDAFTAMNKAWCPDHFSCSVCDRGLNQKTKYYPVDHKPVCKHCYDRFPSDLKKRLTDYYKSRSVK